MMNLGLGINRSKLASTSVNPILAISSLKDVWESDYGITETGIGVSQWNSLNAETSLIQTVDANRPLLVANQINSLPVVRFNSAASKFLYKTTYTTASNMAMCFVFNSDGSAPERMLASFNHRKFSPACYGAGGFIVRTTVGTLNKNAAGWYANNTYTIVVFSYNGTTLDVYVNGQLKVAQPYSGSIAASSEAINFSVGSAWLAAPTLPFNNDIAAVAIFSDSINSTDRQMVENYWSAKYNITLP